MSVLRDVAQYFVDNSLGTFGTDIFSSQMPDSPDAVLVVYEYAGLAPSKLGDNRSPGIQIRTRAEAYEDARASIETAGNLLKEIGNEYNDALASGVIINGTTYLHFQTIQEPFPLGPDSAGRHELAQNFIATYRS